MADTNNERVGKALDLLKEGLAPFVAREVKTTLASKDLNTADLQRFTSDPMLSKRPVVEWDAAALLALMWETWNQVFRQTLGPAERGLVGELRGHRTKWAHQEPFSTDDAYRALDSTHRLLSSVSSPQAGDVETMKNGTAPAAFQRASPLPEAPDHQPVGGQPSDGWAATLAGGGKSSSGRSRRPVSTG